LSRPILLIALRLRSSHLPRSGPSAHLPPIPHFHSSPPLQLSPKAYGVGCEWGSMWNGTEYTHWSPRQSQTHECLFPSFLYVISLIFSRFNIYYLLPCSKQGRSGPITATSVPLLRNASRKGRILQHFPCVVPLPRWARVGGNHLIIASQPSAPLPHSM
jgi:hypothetical protein